MKPSFQMHHGQKRLIRLTRRHDKTARSLASQEKKVGFYFRLPSYVPFVTYADNGVTQDGNCFGQRFSNNELTTSKMF
jgi:hypothetical protein